MFALGAKIGASLQAGDLILLAGALGAGKTLFTQGIGSALGIEGITSPTFVISRVHKGKIDLIHVDAYRLLIDGQANLYLDTKDFVTYKKIITEVLEKSPNDADLIFNLGVISANAKDLVEAEKYYKRAIEIKPDYINAYLNLAILKLDADTNILKEMNKLGNSDNDNKRYLVLKKQREEVFRGALPYLEKAYELNPKNAEVASTLLSVYSALEMTEKKKELKAKM